MAAVAQQLQSAIQIPSQSRLFELTKIIVLLYQREEAICQSQSGLHPRPFVVRYEQGVDDEEGTATVFIAERSVVSEYQHVYRKGLRLRKYGFARESARLGSDLPIFNRVQLPDGRQKWWLSLSRPKLLALLLKPVFAQLKAEGGIVTEYRLGQCLKEITGFKLSLLYKTCNLWPSFGDLVMECRKIALGGSLTFATPSKRPKLEASVKSTTPEGGSSAPVTSIPRGVRLQPSSVGAPAQSTRPIPNVSVVSLPPASVPQPPLLPTLVGFGKPGVPSKPFPTSAGASKVRSTQRRSRSGDHCFWTSDT